MDFSVLMSVYRNDKPEDVRTAVESISTRQTLKPNEIILIVDGPITNSLSNVIIELQSIHSELKVIRLNENQGRGKVLGLSVEMATHDLIAIMDSDDISLPDRFLLQLNYMNAHPEISALGGQITEFIDTPENIVASRQVPLTSSECLSFLKSRDPINHMTVMLRKEDVLKAGNYQHWHLNEDTYLWLRMAEAGCKFANLPETLVNVRVGKDMYARRGGWTYFKSNKAIQDYRLRTKFISVSKYLSNLSIQFIVQVLMPNSIRGWVFKKFLRNK